MKIFKSRNIYDQMKHTSTIIVYLFISKSDADLESSATVVDGRLPLEGGYKDVLVAKEAI